MAYEGVNEKQMAVMVGGVKAMVEKAYEAGISQVDVAEHLFDVSRTVLAGIGGKRLMAATMRRLAAAYDEAADKEEAKPLH